MALRRLLPPQLRKPLPPQGNTTLLAWPTPPAYRKQAITFSFNSTYPYTTYFKSVGLAGKKHGALDIVMPIGQVITAPIDMLITRATNYDDGGYGFNIIGVSGQYEILMAHNSRIYVSKGQRVKRGQRVSLSGNTGISTSPHLHFEVRRNGVKVDPIPLLP